LKVHSLLSGQATYESGRVLGQYLLFHYGSALETTPFSFAPKEAIGFPVRRLDLLDRSNLSSSVTGLDIGCARCAALTDQAMTVRQPKVW
jgi:hypothetical protein